MIAFTDITILPDEVSTSLPLSRYKSHLICLRIKLTPNLNLSRLVLELVIPWMKWSVMFRELAGAEVHAVSKLVSVPLLAVVLLHCGCLCKLSRSGTSFGFCKNLLVCYQSQKLGIV